MTEYRQCTAAHKIRWIDEEPEKKFNSKVQKWILRTSQSHRTKKKTTHTYIHAELNRLKQEWIHIVYEEWHHEQIINTGDGEITQWNRTTKTRDEKYNSENSFFDVPMFVISGFGFLVIFFISVFFFPLFTSDAQQFKLFLCCFPSHSSSSTKEIEKLNSSASRSQVGTAQQKNQPKNECVPEKRSTWIWKTQRKRCSSRKEKKIPSDKFCVPGQHKKWTKKIKCDIKIDGKEEQKQRNYTWVFFSLWLLLGGQARKRKGNSLCLGYGYMYVAVFFSLLLALVLDCLL